MNRQEKTQRWREAVREAANGILTAYFVVMMAVYPFYIRGGYQEIGNVKYYFFRNVSLIVMGVMSVVALAERLVSLSKEKLSVTGAYKMMSVTDWFVYGYLVCNLVSYFFSSYRQEAFWGAEGWYMGLVSQLIFIGCYFFYSRYFVWNVKLLSVTLLASGLIFLLGILNRYSVYPFALDGQTPTFISTLGNINWFCGYWAVLCPLGILFYWTADNVWQRVTAGIYVVIGFLSGMTQGSGSAYLAMAALFLFLFCLSFQGNEKMRRFLEIGILFMLAGQLARALRYVPGWDINYEKEVMILLTDTSLTLYAGIGLLLIYLLFLHGIKSRAYQIAEHKRVRGAALCAAAAVFSGYVILLAVNTRYPGLLSGLSDQPVFTFNDRWANFRGATWTDGFLAFRSMSPLHKITGVGPDCFAEYVYAVPELGPRIYGQFGNARLTNAHNEWLTVLVNQGIPGLICYAGIFVSAFIRFAKGGREKSVLYLCAACVLTYAVHNMVSFQQILNTPYVFILLGVGEGIRRLEKK